MIEDFSIKMDDPKEPEDTRTWHAMDIYVFGNGQQNSPPRKYHLEADQLEWWPITLNYLAGTQYGSIDREIDLYTIDGIKIEDPLQLKNDHAYVAVQKPDDFIDAGYHKYLIKATKSWEKRQSKRGGNNTITINNNNDNSVPTKDDAPPENPPEGLLRTPNNSFLLQTIAQRHSVDSSTSVIKISPGVVENRTENIKTADSKRSSIQAPLRRISSQATPSSSRRPSIKRKESVKSGSVQITGQSEKKVPTRYSSSLYSPEGIKSSKSKLYRGSNVKSSIPPTGLPKVDEVLNEQNRSFDKHNSNSKDKTYVTSSNIVSNNPNEFYARVEVLDVIKPESELAQPKPPDVISLKNVESESIKQKVTEMQKDNKKIRIDSIATASDRETVNCYKDIGLVPTKDNEEVLMNLNPTKESSKYEKEITRDKLLEDKGSTATDKDDVVIKLHIDIWYHNKAPNQTVISASGPQCAISKEKESQANIPNGTISGNRSLPAGCAGTSMDVNRDDQSVIIVKCLSRSFNDESLNAESSAKKSNNKGFIIFLPILQLDESIYRICNCPDELDPKVRQARLSSIRCPVKRTTSCMSLIHTMSYFGSGEGPFGGSVLNISKEPRLSKERGSVVKKKSVILNSDHVCGRIQYAPSIVHEPTNTEIVLIEQATDIILPLKTVEGSTQTEWCNLMMEARLQNDGHYAFYLPSLETLKKYKLHVY